MDFSFINSSTKCEFGSINNISITSKTCNIFDFSLTEPNSGGELNENSTYTELIFKKTSTNPTTIIKHRHYLIKFEENVEINSEQPTITYGKEDNVVPKVTFRIAKSAFYNENLEQIFII